MNTTKQLREIRERDASWPEKIPHNKLTAVHIDRRQLLAWLDEALELMDGVRGGGLRAKRQMFAFLARIKEDQ